MTRIDGWLNQVSVSGDGNHVWGVTSFGDQVWYRAGLSGRWTCIGGSWKQVSVSGDGNHVWGVNSNDVIYYRAGFSSRWRR